MEAIKKLLELLPHKLQVSFALYCAIDCKIHLNKDDTTSLKAIELTEKWLKDESSVTKQELIDAARAAAYAAADASYAAADASYAARAAHAARAARAARAAANAAAHAADAVAYAAYAAAYAAHAARDEKLKQYENHLIQMIKDLTKLEKVIYNIGKDIA